MVPWLGTNMYALWLGSRWLDATNDFGGLIGNCVALEFILHIEEMLLYLWVSERQKREINSILFHPPGMRARAAWVVFFDGGIWVLSAVSWVYVFMWYWQSVLPNYRWDVHGVCGPFL